MEKLRAEREVNLEEIAHNAKKQIEKLEQDTARQAAEHEKFKGKSDEKLEELRRNAEMQKRRVKSCSSESACNESTITPAQNHLSSANNVGSRIYGFSST